MDRGLAEALQQNFSKGQTLLQEARGLSMKLGDTALLGEVALRQGRLSSRKRNFSEARSSFEESLTLSRAAGHLPLEAAAEFYLGNTELELHNWEASIGWGKQSLGLSRRLGMKILIEKNLGNLGDAHSKMGDSEPALSMLLEAETLSVEVGLPDDRANLLTKIGTVYHEREEYKTATSYYLRSLDLAQKMNRGRNIAAALQNLSAVSADVDDLKAASEYNREATEQYRRIGDQADEIYARYTHAVLELKRGQLPQAESEFTRLDQEPGVDPLIHALSRLSLARVHITLKQTALAERDYRQAIRTMDEARASLKQEHYKLLFRSQLSRFYSDYIDLLMQQAKSVQALQVAELGRGQVLAEKAGLDRVSHLTEPQVRATAGMLKAVILAYWLGAEHSYLWVITPDRSIALTLPDQKTITSLVERYRKSVVSRGNPRECADAAGRKLYEVLVAPASQYIPAGGRVVIIPDGILHQLNFETLLVPDQPLPHYWIEDAVISTAAAIALLQPRERVPATRKLLVMGNPKLPQGEYAPLVNAGMEIHDIAKRVPPADRVVLEGELARPSAYRSSNPENFSWIHFAAHGVASAEAPMESAIIPSNDGNTHKLYARDIAKIRLKADLVTISSCYGSGSRMYSGEGMVGLAWAFLFAGAHNVIASLWEVNDRYTPQLMEVLYGRLLAGEDPAHALRNAKLKLLHSDYVSRNPRYWAPFQLYAGY